MASSLRLDEAELERHFPAGGEVGAHLRRYIAELRQAEQALRESEARLEAELADAKLLQQISAEIIQEENADALYEKILDAATAIMRSDFASMQMLHPERGQGGELRLLAFRGFNAEAARFWEWVRADSESTCGMALRTGRRVVAPDVENCDFMAGTENLATCVATGIRAIQTTPLVSRGGKLLGMISTHWRQPHEPSEREFRLFDLIVRQAADLIERRQAAEALRKSEERFRTLFNSIDEGFCTIEVLFNESGQPSDYRFLEVNPAFSKQTGIENAVGRRMRELAPQHEQHWFDIYGRIALTGEALRFQHEAAVLKSWYDVYAFRVGEPGERRVAVLFKDISEEKHLENALREADRQKDQFLATLAHELRNPLAPIRNALHVMQLASGDAQALSESQAIIGRQLTQLIRLVDDLLDVSRIGQGKIDLRLEATSLGEVLGLAVEISRPLIELRKHALRVTLPPEPLPLLGDRARLAQVFSNLLNNAAKFCDAGGQIRVSAEFSADGAVVRIADNGIGIPPEMLNRVFEPFTQVDQSLERKQGGLGIGLALVKRILELHGGCIEAHSAGIGRGSEFVARLPLSRDREGAAAEPDVQQHSAPPACKVLLVDDNQDGARSLASLLRMLGHDVSIAFDGPSALAEAARLRPDVMLLDVGLPQMSGYEVARLVREQPWGRDMRLIAVTGWGRHEDRAAAFRSGFDHHLTKPIDPEALERLLCGAGESHSAVSG